MSNNTLSRIISGIWVNRAMVDFEQILLTLLTNYVIKFEQMVGTEKWINYILAHN